MVRLVLKQKEISERFPLGYSAPMQVYGKLYGHLSTFSKDVTGENENVCVGKEWYRFPSHFFIPSERHASVDQAAKCCSIADASLDGRSNLFNQRLRASYQSTTLPAQMPLGSSRLE